MWIGEIEVGSVHTVQIPDQLPVQHPPVGGLTSQQWLDLVLLRGNRLHVVVTGLNPADDPPAVDGVRVATTDEQVEVELTAEQCEQLGLPPDNDYAVRDQLLDAEDHGVVVPALHHLRVPVQWIS